MTDTPKISLSEILDKLPPELKPWAEKYGPTLLEMGQVELLAWVGRLIDGDIEAAYLALLARMNNADALSEGEDLVAEWKQSNTKEAERRAFFKNLALDAAKVLLAILAARVAL